MHDRNPGGTTAVLLIHPMLASARIMEEMIGTRLGPDCRLLLPDLADHGEDLHTPYPGAAAEADAIRRYLEEQNIRTIHLAYGASLGGVVLMDLLRRPGTEFQSLFFEGTSFYEKASFLGKTLQSVFLHKHKRAKADPNRAVEQMKLLFGQQMAQPLARQFIAMSDQTICGIARDCTHVPAVALTPELQRHCTFAYGSKDPTLSEARKLIKTRYPEASLKIWDGYDHCERITADPEGYAAVLNALL